MSTIQQVINDCRSYIGDKDTVNSTYSTDLILRALNNFGRDVTALGLNRSLATDLTLTSGTYQYSYPTNFWYPVAARIKSSSLNYIPIPILEGSNVHDYDIKSGQVKGQPEFIFILDNKICVYPTPETTYYLNLEMVKRITVITSADLTKQFSEYFDQDYEDYAIDYVAMNVLPKNDSLSKEIRSLFYGYQGAWQSITRLESMKYKPFNARNRRTSGANLNNNLPDYSDPV
jgi:hypothetical protein